ncbi:hypothetical protein DdX_09136 [Ditylenchus destructor]|uniref:Uncharacterized protein n=1 Tax=Ditylenchus destructor TaxID=166010 RepID=A0AAD4N6J1_9BILA|nr:hypothetical protein DdX_09136 [Ditylenchus destructor]
MNLLYVIKAGEEFHLPAFMCPIIHCLRTASFLFPIFSYYLLAIERGTVILILFGYLPAAYSMTAPYYGIKVPLWLERASSVFMPAISSCSIYIFVRFALDYQSRTKEVTVNFENGCKAMFRRLWMCNGAKVRKTGHADDFSPQLESIGIQTISKLVDASTNTDIPVTLGKCIETSV